MSDTHQHQHNPQHQQPMSYCPSSLSAPQSASASPSGKLTALHCITSKTKQLALKCQQHIRSYQSSFATAAMLPADSDDAPASSADRRRQQRRRRSSSAGGRVKVASDRNDPDDDDGMATGVDSLNCFGSQSKCDTDETDTAGLLGSTAAKTMTSSLSFRTGKTVKKLNERTTVWYAKVIRIWCGCV